MGHRKRSPIAHRAIGVHNFASERRGGDGQLITEGPLLKAKDLKLKLRDEGIQCRESRAARFSSSYEGICSICCLSHMQQSVASPVRKTVRGRACRFGFTSP